MPSWPGVFQFGTFWVLLRVNQSVFSPSIFVIVLLTPCLCCLSIRFFCYVLFVPIICSKIVLLPCHPLFGMSSYILPLPACRIFFHCFGISCFVCMVLSCLDTFLVFLLSPVPSSLFPRVVFTCVAFFLFTPICSCVFPLSYHSYLRFLSNFLFRFWVSIHALSNTGFFID